MGSRRSRKLSHTQTSVPCGTLNYVKLIRESIWFAMIDSRIDSVRNILIRCTPTINPMNLRTKFQKDRLNSIP